jgi:alkylhydroperoxidase family enzyme
MAAGDVPRIPPLSAETSAARAEESGVPSYMARLSVFRVLLHHPRLAGALNGVLGTLLFDSLLDVRLRELIIMRLGWSTGSVYEWTQHWRIATDLGVPAEDVVGVRHWEDHGGFGPADRAVLSAVDDTLELGTLRPGTWEALRAHVSDDPAVLLEVVAVIGLWRMVAGVLRSVEVPLDAGLEPWPPDGVAPAGPFR